MNKHDKAEILEEYKRLKEIDSKTSKRLKELKQLITSEITEGQYENMILTYDFREVKEYTVAARTDMLIKITEIKK